MNTLLSHLMIATMNLVSEEPIDQPEFALFHLPDVEFYLNMMNHNEFFIKAHGTYFEVKIVESQRAKNLNVLKKSEPTVDFKRKL